jgi:ferredoxin-NADP reductase
LREARHETATARTLVLDVPGWPGHLAGQHVIVRLTAEDGYTAQRSYSIASAPPPAAAAGEPGLPAGGQLEITVQRLTDGEVSPYLADVMEPGDKVEVRGPVGGWFVWPGACGGPVQLVAGGSGIVPLMSMIRAARGTVPFRLLYSVRTPADVIYAAELAQRSRHPSLGVSYLYTRAGQGRISAAIVAAATWPPEARPSIFACGPSGFVEAASGLLVAAGHDPATIKTERFGPTG